MARLFLYHVRARRGFKARINFRKTCPERCLYFVLPLIQWVLNLSIGGGFDEKFPPRKFHHSFPCCTGAFRRNPRTGPERRRCADLREDRIPCSPQARLSKDPLTTHLPPQETVLTYSPDTSYRQSLLAEHNIVLFGLHPCDLAGIAYLDKAFAAAGPDPMYRTRRRNLTLIGISCDPDEYCFCTEVGAAVPPIFDLYLHRAPDGFHIETGSSRGEDIFAEVASLLEECEGPAEPRLSCGSRSAISSRSISPLPGVRRKKPNSLPLLPHSSGGPSRCFPVIRSAPNAGLERTAASSSRTTRCVLAR